MTQKINQEYQINLNLGYLWIVGTLQDIANCTAFLCSIYQIILLVKQFMLMEACILADKHM